MATGSVQTIDNQMVLNSKIDLFFFWGLDEKMKRCHVSSDAAYYLCALGIVVLFTVLTVFAILSAI